MQMHAFGAANAWACEHWTALEPFKLLQGRQIQWYVGKMASFACEVSYKKTGVHIAVLFKMQTRTMPLSAYLAAQEVLAYGL